jgi:hypothetical protein
MIHMNTSRTAQGGGGSFKDRKPVDLSVTFSLCTYIFPSVYLTVYLSISSVVSCSCSRSCSCSCSCCRSGAVYSSVV